MLLRARGIPARGLSASEWATWTFHSLADEQQRLYEAWHTRQLHVHALVATSTHDQQTAQRAWETLASDRPPPVPWHNADDEDDERWSESRLEADLLMGVRWPFFRDRSVERALSNGHHAQQSAESEEAGL